MNMLCLHFLRYCSDTSRDICLDCIILKFCLFNNIFVFKIVEIIDDINTHKWEVLPFDI